MASTVPHDFTNGGIAYAEEVDANFAAVLGGVDGVAQTVGVPNPQTAPKLRRASIVATQESRTNTAFGLLTTPDRVSGIVLPTNGVLSILFRAIWYSSVASAGRTAVFIGSNQLRIPAANNTTGDTALAEATSGGANNWLTTNVGGLASTDGAISGMEGTDAVTTGLVVGARGSSFSIGGWLAVELPAGSYDVSVQFRATSGSVNVCGRKLWVLAEGF